MSFNTLADIAYSLRFSNLTDEDDAQIPAPWFYDNIPQPTRIERKTFTRYGKGAQPTYEVQFEYFADGSFFGRSVAQ